MATETWCSPPAPESGPSRRSPRGRRLRRHHHRAVTTARLERPARQPGSKPPRRGTPRITAASLCDRCQAYESHTVLTEALTGDDRGCDVSDQEPGLDAKQL